MNLYMNSYSYDHSLLKIGKNSVEVQSKRVYPKVRTQKGIAIADYMWTLGHCQDTGENLEILKGGPGTQNILGAGHWKAGRKSLLIPTLP